MTLLSIRHAIALAAALVLFSGCLTPVSEFMPVDAGTGGGGGNTGGGGGNTGGGGGNTGGGGGNTGGGGGLTPLTCTTGTWCWQHPLPQGQALNSVFAVSQTEAWAVGDRGAMVRLLNGAWTAMTPITTHALSNLAGSSANNVWAIGRLRSASGGSGVDSQVVHFDGAAWSVVPHGALPVVLDVATGPSGETWVLTAGTSTTVPPALLRWTGSALAPAAALPTAPAGLRPTSVCVRSANEVWVLAADELNSFPKRLYKWDGATWSLVHGLSANLRFNSRVGCPADGVALAQVYEFDTRTTSLLEARSGAVTFRPIADDSDLVRTPRGEVFLASRNSVSLWTPTGLQPRFTFPPQLSALSAGFDFFGASGWLVYQKPTIATWDGAAFVAPPVQGFLRAFAAPTGPTPTDPVAAFGEGVWARRAGDTWTFFAMPTLSNGARLSVNHAYNLPDGAWLAGTGLARYDSTAQTITPQAIASGVEFSAIDGSDPNTVWAVGTQATVLRFDGTRWGAPPVAPPETVNGTTFNQREFEGVDVRSANDVVLFATDVAGGAFASIFYRWDGATWTGSVSYGTTLVFLGRDTAGTVYALEGEVVKKRPAGAAAWVDLGPISGYGSRSRVLGVDEVEVVVNSGTDVGLYRWDAGQRRFAPRGPSVGFPGAVDVVVGASAGGRQTLWSLGAFGAVLRYEPAP